ncbi:MAG: CysZ protein [Pseudohongiellaceae bacterium]
MNTPPILTFFKTINTMTNGFNYMVRGAKIIASPGMKRFVLIPLVANVIIFLFLTSLLIQYFSAVTRYFSDVLSGWAWMAYFAAIIATVLSGLAAFIILLIYGYSFNLITNVIAAPFYGMLAEKIEHKLTGNVSPEESISSLTVRTLQRELVKLWYFISRSLLVFFSLFVLAFIPILNFLVPFLAVSWGAWVMTLQYVDYPADNNHISFNELRRQIKNKRYSTLGFGGVILIGSMVPIINIFIMPIAVAGGTLFWVNELSDQSK